MPKLILTLAVLVLSACASLPTTPTPAMIVTEDAGESQAESVSAAVYLPVVDRPSRLLRGARWSLGAVASEDLAGAGMAWEPGSNVLLGLALTSPWEDLGASGWGLGILTTVSLDGLLGRGNDDQPPADPMESLAPDSLAAAPGPAVATATRCRGVGIGERFHGSQVRYKCGSTKAWLTSQLNSRATCAFGPDGSFLPRELPEVQVCFGLRYWGGEHVLGQEGCGPSQHGRGGLRSGPLRGLLRALADHPDNPLRLPRPHCPIADIDDQDCRALHDRCPKAIVTAYNKTFGASIPIPQPPLPAEIDPGEAMTYEMAVRCMSGDLECVPTRWCDQFPSACRCWEWWGARVKYDPTKPECRPADVVAAGPQRPVPEPEPEPPDPPEPEPEPTPTGCGELLEALEVARAAAAAVCVEGG